MTQTSVEVEISELEIALTRAGNTASRAETLNRLAHLVGQSDLDRAIALAEDAKRTACYDANGRLVPKAYAETCLTLAQLLVESARYARARELATEALSLFETHHQLEGQLRAMLASTHAHLGMGNYPHALELGLAQLDLADTLDSRQARAGALDSIGLVYAALGDHQVALEHHGQARELGRLINAGHTEFFAIANCSKAARRLGQLEAAVAYARQALDLAQANEIAKEHALIRLGDAYSSLERYADAEKYLDEGLRLAARSGRKPVQVLALCSLGELWNKQRRHESALSPLREATDLATGSGARPAMMRCHLALYKANKSLGEFEPALLHCEHHHALKSQLYSEQMSTRLRNLEDRHRTDAAIKEAKTVQDQVTELEHLNYAISHDLKGPLLTIRAFADLLAQDLAANDRTKVSGDLNWIRSAAATMQKRVSELLKLSQVRPGRYSFVTVDVNELIDEVINSLGGPISERGSLIQVKQDLPEVLGDPETLAHVFQNLVENAMKFSRPGSVPHIEVGARSEHGGMVFYVTDDDIGIESKFHASVFRLFERLNPDIEGSGVGLALVKRIIEAHGGKVWVESEPQRGCSVCFVLGAEPPTGAVRRD